MERDWICPGCGRADATSIGPGALCPHDGRVLVDAERAGGAVDDPVLGRVVGGQYAVYDRLGRGGMGAVYRAMHRRLRRHVALKTILPERSGEDAADLRARFEQEALVVSELRHPGIVTVHDFGEEDGILYMVLELVEGASLADALRRTPRLFAPRAIDIARQLVDALGEAHRRGLIHRDIKPSNVMLEPRADGTERVVLIDFGVAKARAGVLPEFGPNPRTQTGVAVGTPRYMAPEQLAGGEPGPWTDHYAVGVLLYRMLAGQSPFVGAPAEMIAAHLRDPVPPLPPELGLAPLDEVIAQAMAKKPGDRFPDGPAFIAALDTALALIAARPTLDGMQLTAPMAAVSAEEARPAISAPVPAARPSISAPVPVGAPLGPRRSAGELPAPSVIGLPSLAPSGAPVVDPTPSDFSSGWRGAVDATGHAEVASFGPTRRRRWLLATAALVGLAMLVGGLLATRDTPPDPPVAAASTAPAVTPVAAPPVMPDAAPPPPDAAPPDAAPPDAAAPDAAPDTAPRRAPQRAVRRAPRRPSTADLSRAVRRHLDACACGEAERALARLARADRAAADQLDGAYTTACGLVGVGCLAGGAGAR